MAPFEELRSAIEHLACLDRSSCSPGEQEAAEWIAGALVERGAAASVELERVHGTYWWPLGITSAVGAVAGLAARRGHRLAGAAAAAAAVAVAVDELGAGRRPLRRVLPKKTTANVVAYAGDQAATRTLLVVSHHDAAHTGTFFDPRLTRFLSERFHSPGDEVPRQPPVMVPIVAAPALVAVAALLGLRRLMLAGAVACAGVIGSFADMALRSTVPGANDNLTGVATVLGVAGGLAEDPVENLRVVLVSTGAEESLMEGMRAFAARHFADLPAGETSVLCVDTVGSPYLVLPEEEGMFRVRRYDGGFKELIAECAAREGVVLRRGLRMRLGTDGYLALRHGVPAAMLMSIDRHGTASNYHWPTDTADRVDYGSLADAVRLCLAVVRRLADEAAPEGVSAGEELAG